MLFYFKNWWYDGGKNTNININYYIRVNIEKHKIIKINIGKHIFIKIWKLLQKKIIWNTKIH